MTAALWVAVTSMLHMAAVLLVSLHCLRRRREAAAAIVGTANLDARSLSLNYETNLVVYDEPFIDEVARAVNAEIAVAEEVNADLWRRRPMTQRLARNFCALLAPVL